MIVSGIQRAHIGFIALIAAVLAIQLVMHPLRSGDAKQTQTPVWHLTWSDEFNGPNGSLPDLTRWSFDTGGAWGERELQHYTNRNTNAHVSNGALVITAQKEDYKGNHYTSARIQTQGKFEQRYGRFEARMRLPSGKGVWPAFWLVGNDIDQVDWPAYGEIDVMELIGSNPAQVYVSVHGPSPFDIRSHTIVMSLPGAQTFTDAYHLFSIEWEPLEIRFYVDEIQYAVFTPQHLFPGEKWVYDHPFCIILNLAIGGEWPGNPDDSTTFPAAMFVDYVRVYAKQS